MIGLNQTTRSKVIVSPPNGYLVLSLTFLSKSLSAINPFHYVNEPSGDIFLSRSYFVRFLLKIPENPYRKECLKKEDF